MFCLSFPPLSIDYESLVDNNNNNNKFDINHSKNKFDISVYNNALVELDCPLLSQNMKLSVIGSCNGLICYVVGRFNVVIYNPSTRVSKELPQPTSSSSTPPLYFRNYYYGFGFDSSNDDYKVVFGCDIIADGYKSIRFHVFSLRHNSWIRIQDLSLGHLGTFLQYAERSNGIFLNGALHWLLVPRDIESLHSVILCFQLSTDKMSLDNIQCERDSRFYTLGAFEECLYAVARSYGATQPSVGLWLLKEYGVKASWTKFITIPCGWESGLTPLCFSRNGELLLKIDNFFPDPHTKLESYNTERGEFTVICNCPSSSKVDLVLYVESLVEPNSFDGNVERLQALGQSQ